MIQDLAFAIPGVDEAMSFAEIMKSGAFVHLKMSKLTDAIDTSSPCNTR